MTGIAKLIGENKPNKIAATALPDDVGAGATRHLIRHEIFSTSGRVEDYTRAPEDRVVSLEHRLFDALASAKILTSRVAMHLSNEWRRKIFLHLDSLHSLEDWEEEDLPVDQDSFNSFLRGLIYLAPKKIPGLGLSRDGKIIASWVAGSDRLTLEFGKSDRVRWVLSYTVDDERERAAGDTTATRLSAVLEPYLPDRWLNP